MSAPRRLAEWPWVTVELECSLCRKHGRYRVPAGGPLPDEAPAREARPGETWPPRTKRLGPEGPLPTIASVLAQGCTGVLVYCTGRLASGYSCHHQGRVDIDDLALPLEWPFIHIARARRLRCSRCGSREVEVRSDRPGLRGQRLGPDNQPLPPAIPGVTPEPRPPGNGPLPRGS